MKSGTVLFSAIAIVAITVSPVYAGFLEDFKKDWGKVTDTLKEAIEDVTKGKEDVEEIDKDAKSPQGEFTGVGDDEPRYDSPWVAEFQQRLAAVGLNPGPVDGAFGKKTSNAIITFQKTLGLNTDGMPRPSVMRALRARTQNIQTAQQATPAATEPGATAGSTEIAATVTPTTSPEQQPSATGGNSLSFAQWGTAVGMPGSCGIACFDAIVEACKGNRDPSYRLETERLAQAQLEPKKFAQLLTQYDNGYSRQRNYYMKRRSQACTQLNNEGFREKQLAVKYARQAGHPKFVNPIRHEPAPEARPAEIAGSPSGTQVAQAQSPDAGLSNFLAPAGVTIGMAIDKARSVLAASNFKELQPCSFRSENQRFSISLNYLRENHVRQKCHGPVKSLLYRQTQIPLGGSALTIINRVNEQFGANPKCTSLAAQSAICGWSEVPTSSLVKSASVSIELPLSLLTLQLKAVDDLVQKLDPTESDQATSAAAPSATGPSSGETIASSTDLLPGGLMADGLVICAQEEFLPLSSDTTGKILVEKGAATDDLRSLLKDLGLGESIYAAPAATNELRRAVEVVGWPVAFHDERVSRQKDGREYGDIGRALGMDQVAKHCKLVVKKKVTGLIEAPAEKTVKVATSLGVRSITGPTQDLVDPLQPEGVAVGMGVWQVMAALKSKGYTVGSRCDFGKNRDDGGWIRLKVLSGPPGLGCQPEEPIHTIQFRASNFKVTDSMLAVESSMSQKLGAKGKCTQLTEQRANCIWQSVPQTPLISQVVLRGSISDVISTVRAVHDLEARVTVPPAPVVKREKLWWEVELESADASADGTGFALGPEYAALAPELHSKIGSEARMVYDYCKKRDLFAKLHDCHCVAERFMDKRAKFAAEAPWHQPGKNSLIGMADDVADQCPASKAHIASYAYDTCTRTHGPRLQDGTRPFCTCYADRFAEYYEQDPRSFFPAMGKKGSMALLSCSEEISPNPLQ